VGSRSWIIMASEVLACSNMQEESVTVLPDLSPILTATVESFPTMMR
jgi:hypothetical protein